MARPGKNRREIRKREAQRRKVGSVSRFASVENIALALRRKIESKGYRLPQNMSVDSYLAEVTRRIKIGIRGRDKSLKLSSQFSQHEKNWMAGKTITPTTASSLVFLTELGFKDKNIKLKIVIGVDGSIRFMEST